jgi:hypothetical protein
LTTVLFTSQVLGEIDMSQVAIKQPSRASLGQLVSDSLMLLELKHDPTYANRPLSSLAFDWSYTLFSIMLTLGLWLDIWSHNAFGPDQSVFNEFHMLFYGALISMTGFLAYTHFTSLKKGVAWRHSLPKGYGLATLGVIIFGGSGFFDLIGHALFGFETGMEAIFSPSHIGLFIGWFIISFAAINAAFARRHVQKLTLVQSLPMLIGGASALSSLTTIILYAAVLGNLPAATQTFRTPDEYTGLMSVIPGQYMQTAAIAALGLWLVTRFKLPFGTFASLYTIFGLFLFVYNQGVFAVIILFLSGLLTDLAYSVLRPSLSERWKLLTFAYLLPVILWGVYYNFFVITNVFGGIWFTNYIWVGTIFQSGFIGFFIAFFLSAKRDMTTAEEN